MSHPPYCWDVVSSGGSRGLNCRYCSSKSAHHVVILKIYKSSIFICPVPEHRPSHGWMSGLMHITDWAHFYSCFQMVLKRSVYRSHIQAGLVFKSRGRQLGVCLLVCNQAGILSRFPPRIMRPANSSRPCQHIICQVVTVRLTSTR